MSSFLRQLYCLHHGNHHCRLNTIRPLLPTAYMLHLSPSILWIFWIQWRKKEQKDVSSLIILLHLDVIYVYVVQCSVMILVKLGHIFTKVWKLGNIKNKAKFIGWIIGCRIISKIKFRCPRDNMKTLQTFKQPKVQMSNAFASTEYLNLLKFFHSYIAVMTIY